MAMIAPPAMISAPPTHTCGDGACLNAAQEMTCAITKKKTTYSPNSLPKSHGGQFTVQP